MHVRVMCNFAVSAHFLPGSSNQLADALARLDLGEGFSVPLFYGQTPSTLRSYKSGKDRYTKFCRQAKHYTCTRVKTLFVSHIAKQ